MNRTRDEQAVSLKRIEKEKKALTSEIDAAREKLTELEILTKDLQRKLESDGGKTSLKDFRKRIDALITAVDVGVMDWPEAMRKLREVYG